MEYLFDLIFLQNHFRKLDSARRLQAKVSMRQCMVCVGDGRAVANRSQLDRFIRDIHFCLSVLQLTRCLSTKTTARVVKNEFQNIENEFNDLQNRFDTKYVDSITEADVNPIVVEQDDPQVGVGFAAA